MTIKDLFADWVAWTMICFVVVGSIKLLVVVLGWLFYRRDDMSYNVWLEAKFWNASNPVQLGPNYNISDDCSEMVTASVGSAPVVWDGRLATELLPELSDGINLLIFHSDNYHKYESADGWCTVSGCRDFLIKFQALCKNYPYATVREK